MLYANSGHPDTACSWRPAMIVCSRGWGWQSTPAARTLSRTKHAILLRDAFYVEHEHVTVGLLRHLVNNTAAPLPRRKTTPQEQIQFFKNEDTKSNILPAA